MQSHELFREIFDKRKPEEIAGDLGLSASMIYKWSQPCAAGSGVRNPLDRMEALIKNTGDTRLAQWICQRAGGFFIANPQKVPHPHHLIPATNQIVQDFADLLHVIAAATADEKITAAEARQMRDRWEELKSVTEGFVASCEQGDFTTVHKAHQKRAATGASQLRL